MSAEGLQGLLALGAFVALTVGFAALNSRWPIKLRHISAFEALNKAIERAVEGGERVHLSLGTGSLVGSESAPALAGLAALTRITRATSMSDRPVVVSTGDGAMAILARDTLRATYDEVGAPELYEPTAGRLLGPTPFSYAAGLPSMLQDEQVSVHMLNGSFGYEAGLAADFGERAHNFVIAGSDDVQSQALLYAVAQEPLIGEEVFATPAYMEAGTVHKASLRAQDAIRFIILALIVLGAVIETIT